MGMGCSGGGGGLAKSWLLAVPGLASLLSDCVQSNPTSEWAEPHSTPLLNPRPGLTLRAPDHRVLDWCVLSFYLPPFVFFIPKAGQEILWEYRSQVEFQASLVIAV